ncbi:MAG: hypothetical protein LC754_09115 [Acidobacteria bacterium]|nr:hypothetical protein [Acidobacteriota bacterium]
MRRLSVTLYLICLCMSGITVCKGQEPEQREPVIEFEGNRVFSQQQLFNVADKCLTQYPRSLRGNPEALHYCMWKVKLFLGCQGYMRAEVGRPKMQASGSGEKVIVLVDEGVRYRLGSLKVEGTKLFPPERLIEMLDLKTGDVASGGVLQEWLHQKVRAAYADRGYIQYDQRESEAIKAKGRRR